MAPNDVGQTSSLEDVSSRHRGEEKPKSKRPKIASRPILTPRTVLPFFFAVGIIFAPIGGLLIWASSQVRIFFAPTSIVAFMMN
ncbi:hypothetical protein KEM55_000593 [Ascosphaera atra]|nr:hypothetical protein KEM55_000593 [Ascosphaera atra]